MLISPHVSQAWVHIEIRALLFLGEGSSTCTLKDNAVVLRARFSHI